MPKRSDPIPLAERVRPTEIKDYVGQKSVTGSQQLIRSLLDNKDVISMLLWGPPGCGKTTLARILAANVDAACVELSAAIHGTADLRKVIDAATERGKYGQKTILFIDEIHRFNKTQQGALLPFVENGTVVLIAATTENPSFEVIGPLLSRCRVVILEPLSKKDLKTILLRASKRLPHNILDNEALDLIANRSGGDARTGLNLLEAASLLSKTINPEVVERAARSQLISYDRAGDEHYNTISAYIKSLRGSDVDAALYYLGRMLAGGEDPTFIARRLVIFASEDIGEAWHGALTLSLNVYQAVERIGLPEGTYSLVHGTVALAKAPKSRVLADTLHVMQATVSQFGDAPIPLQARNAPTKLMKDLGYGDGYQWKADFVPPNGFLPDQLSDTTIYTGNRPE